ncbi:isocitrate lyase/PEP mutase family protein [Streptomyces sp. NPDC004539]|uniref:isocitrate lyase/PEP mutase family protein n=1 Tax=Streptomyces sp. NPDC004539 TaxID=3154280 RepID=UPI0033BBC838
MSNSNSKTLRALLDGDTAVLAAGVHDAFSAKLAESIGFEALFMSGYAVSAVVNAKPDWSFSSMTDFLGVARNVVNAVDIPLICDVDQGFGPVTNLIHTIQSFQRAGVAGVVVEDQVFPKQSCYEDGRELYPVQQAAARVRAACEAKEDPDFILVARSEASRMEGPGATMRRFEAYLAAGADYVIPVDCEIEDLSRYCKELPGRVFAFGGAHSESLDLDEVGVKAILHSADTLLAAHQAMETLYRELLDKRKLSPEFYLAHPSKYPDELDAVLDQPYWEAVRNRYEEGR